MNRIRLRASHCLIELPESQAGWRRTLFLEGETARSFREELMDQLLQEKELQWPSSSLEIRLEEENGNRHYLRLDQQEWAELLEKSCRFKKKRMLKGITKDILSIIAVE